MGKLLRLFKSSITWLDFAQWSVNYYSAESDGDGGSYQRGGKPRRDFKIGCLAPPDDKVQVGYVGGSVTSMCYDHSNRECYARLATMLPSKCESPGDAKTVVKNISRSSSYGNMWSTISLIPVGRFLKTSQTYHYSFFLDGNYILQQQLVIVRILYPVIA